MDSSSYRIINDRLDKNDAISAGEEVNKEIADFCKALQVKPGALALDNATLGMFISMRMFKLLSAKIKEIEARLDAASPKAQHSATISHMEN